MKAKSFWHSDGLADDKKECALAHSRAERGRLRHISSLRECASRGAFLCHRTKFPMTQKRHMTSKKVMWRKVDRNLEKSTYQF